MVRRDSESDGTHHRRTVLKAGLVATTGVAGLSTAGFAQNDGSSEDHVITLTVVDQDGNPLQGEVAIFEGNHGDIVDDRELDENGQATWEVSREGQYSYDYIRSGYEMVSEDTTFEVDGGTEVTVEMRKEDWEVGDNTITVTALDEETGKPVEGARVELVGGLPGPAESVDRGETNAEGVYEATVPAVMQAVSVDLVDGYYGDSALVDLSEGDAEVTIELTPASGSDDGGEDSEGDESPADGEDSSEADSDDSVDCEKRT
ncbi:FixH family protein [Halalkalicoccus jeotgali]|uniref:Uncharacterized protein n=1 Tax=Halalkalicoccus jeotgali (strain DSM 18796 / CECT 7217 / JCM 14584 / KCTC 4019 / B3) TaxID=795797 RepID=D8JA48_HALJB|nr:FixH family protein [Halalkalicoccus jeotgali]ADJ14570.1 hypothetical protein HacjB3_05895 [Halalkalicoccus jeotgali B3]ELY39942.1 hypothetical protein C497_04267 [Halalkalicoccus jeotgali B3]